VQARVNDVERLSECLEALRHVVEVACKMTEVPRFASILSRLRRCLAELSDGCIEIPQLKMFSTCDEM
jgi:hypothetical protein